MGSFTKSPAEKASLQPRSSGTCLAPVAETPPPKVAWQDAEAAAPKVTSQLSSILKDRNSSRRNSNIKWVKILLWLCTFYIIIETRIIGISSADLCNKFYRWTSLLASCFFLFLVFVLCFFFPSLPCYFHGWEVLSQHGYSLYRKMGELAKHRLMTKKQWIGRE